MGLDDRLLYLLLGMAIGFVLGRFTRSLRDIKEELDEVDELVKEHNDPNHHRNEGGFVKPTGVGGIALLIVIVVTVGGAFFAQKAANDAQSAIQEQDRAQDRLIRVTRCNAAYLSKTIAALNERTTYTGQQAHANVDLQKDQFTFFNLLLHRPPYPADKQFSAAQDYKGSLQQFLEVAGKAQDKAKQNPYPTNKELNRCLAFAVK